MQMTNEEIVMRYRQAKIKGDQVQILAELNACPVERIIGILVSAGIDNRNFNRLRNKFRLQEEQAANEAVEAVKDFDAALSKGQEVEEYEVREVTFCELPEDTIVDVPRIPYKKPEIIEAPPMSRIAPVEAAKEIASAIAVAKKPQESYYCEELFEPIRNEVAALMNKRRSIYTELRKVDTELAKYVEFFSAQMLQIDTLRKERDENESN